MGARAGAARVADCSQRLARPGQGRQEDRGYGDAGPGRLTDEQIASILTYVRREWGHEADAIEIATVAKVRADTATRGDAQWTMDELLKIK